MTLIKKYPTHKGVCKLTVCKLLANESFSFFNGKTYQKRDFLIPVSFCLITAPMYKQVSA